MKTFEERIKSPCESKCELDSKGEYCIGCRRTIDEIRSWLLLEKNDRISIITRIDACFSNRE